MHPGISPVRYCAALGGIEEDGELAGAARRRARRTAASASPALTYVAELGRWLVPAKTTPGCVVPIAGQVRRAEVRGAGARVRVAVQCSRPREHLRALCTSALSADCSGLRSTSATCTGDLATRAPPSPSRPSRSATPIETMVSDDRDHRDGPAQQAPLAAAVEERQREQQHERDRRHADRAEDHRLRPLEDPQQVEEEVEVPVRPRDEARRARVGRRVVQRPEPARRRRRRARPPSTSRSPRAR